MAWRRKSQKVINDSILLHIYCLFAFFHNHVVQSLNVNSNHKFLKRNFLLTIFQYNLNQHLDLVELCTVSKQKQEKMSHRYILVFWEILCDCGRACNMGKGAVYLKITLGIESLDTIVNSHISVHTHISVHLSNIRNAAEFFL